ncbi:sodium channel subunit beta-4-like isoform X1 [Xiphophorus hellerii]|uniref:sodium channel subunit beta-4-like isoform X1 n=1 Tax=Xiphophorus hellerii TaxID=8084 RepID=UPI0013B43C3C|nr:sodium channel subunit beta-4-like isoform X1 [Xiphophorus hellerii]
MIEMVSLKVSLLWTLWISSVSAEGHVKVRGEPGQSIILPCSSAANSSVIVVQWSRTDLGSEYVLLFRDGRFDVRKQNPSYQNRVDLVDQQMKKGNVSLVLKNLTINDTGLYQCQVQNEGSLDTKLIRTIRLEVISPEKKNGGTSDGSIGLIVGLILLILLAVVVVLFLIYKKQSACFRKKSSDPPVDL